MLMKSVLSLSFVAFAMIGCGGDDTTTPTNDDLAVVGNDLAGTRLESGSYTVSALVKDTDGCGLDFEGSVQGDTALASLQLLNTGKVLSLGNMFGPTSVPSWNPAAYSAGTGGYTDATHATLTTNTMVDLGDGCTYTTSRTTLATFTGNDMMSIDFTDNETAQSAGCLAANGESTTACTSHYTFNLAM
jgi:hypothetical protein